MSDVLNTIHIFLDSDEALKMGNTKVFQFSPGIHLENDVEGLIYLKSFSCQNSVRNISESAGNQINRINFGNDIFGNETNDVEIVIPEGHYKDPTELASLIQELLRTAGGVSGEQINVSFHSPTLTFNVSKNNAVIEKVAGYLFTQVLNFTPSNTFSLTSSGPVDLNRDFHNLYVSVNEIQTNSSNVSSGLGIINNKIGKIAIVNEYGSYINFLAQEPVSKFKLTNNLQQISVKLFTDNAILFEPERFTMTICVEIRLKNEVRNREMVFGKLLDRFEEHESIINDKSLNYRKDVPVFAPAIIRNCKQIINSRK